MGWLNRTKQGGEGIVHQTEANRNRQIDIIFLLEEVVILPYQDLSGPQNCVIE